MSIRSKPFELKPEHINYATTPDGKRVRVTLTLVRDGCAAPASAEQDDLVSAVIAAINRALERWFDVGRVNAVPNGSILSTLDGWLCRAFAYSSGGGLERGEATHTDVAKAAALAYVAAINKLIAVLGIEALVATDPQATQPA
ncbi:MAG: hypothetical protein EXS68_02290 [Candidatus Ryanbacteria bacterium]|nr:hypothetical protein [Candidatus Ryanbacteria bacterium]